MSEKAPTGISVAEQPLFEQDPSLFRNFHFMGQVELNDGSMGDAYLHVMTQADGDCHDGFGIAVRESDEESDYSYMRIYPMDGPEYESFVTGQYNVFGKQEKQPLKTSTHQGLRRAIALGLIDEVMLVADIEPDFWGFRNIDPAIKERIVALQGFSSVEEWEKEWREALEIQTSMIRNRKPTIDEIREENDYFAFRESLRERIEALRQQ